MNAIDRYAVTRRWPAQHPDRIQLYSLPTPNGVKVSIMLEETGLPYEAHRVSFDTGDQHTPEFLSVSPNNKIPALVDPQGPNGEPLALFESGAILLYLAHKSGGALLPTDEAGRWHALQWLMFASFPWINNLVGFYGAGELVGFADYPQVQRALSAFLARPAVQRGLLIPARPG
jgi:GST-like protein